MLPRVLAELTTLLSALGALALALALLHLIERAAARRLSQRLGWRAVLLTGWIGVPLHEFSHLLAALLFGHRIVAWKLFDPDPVSGTLGYVRHGVRHDTAWQRLGYLASGLAPAIVGLLIVSLILQWMLPAGTLPKLAEQATAARLSDFSVSSLEALLTALAALGSTLAAALWAGRSPWLPLQIYLLLALGSHLAPSRADLRLAGRGLLGALLLLGLATVATTAAKLPSPGTFLLAVLPAVFGLVLVVGLVQAAYVGVVRLATRRPRGGMQLELAPAKRRGA